MGETIKKSHLRLTGQTYLDKALDGQLEQRDCTVRSLSGKLETADPVESTTNQFVEAAADHEASELERWEDRK